jgi:hypothetical protein
MMPEPTITLTELIEQLRRVEGQVITNAAGLAMTIIGSAENTRKAARDA